MLRWRTRSLFYLFSLFLLFSGACSLSPRRAFIQLPDIPEEENPLKKQLLRIFKYWRIQFSQEELKGMLNQPFEFLSLEKICEKKGMVCLYAFLDLRTVEKLLRENIPILGYWEQETLAPAWGTIIRHAYLGYIINGYDPKGKLLYVTLPREREAVAYPYDLFPILWWAGRREAIALLIIPQDKKKLVLSLLPPRSLEKGEVLKHIWEEEQFYGKEEEFPRLAEKIIHYLEKRKSIVKSFPNWAYAYYLAGYPLFMLEDKKEGLDMLEKARELEPSLFYRLALASAYATLTQYNKARKELEKCGVNKPEELSLSYLFLRTYLDVKEGKNEEAEKMLRNTLASLDEENYLKKEIRLLFALLKFEEGKPAEAMKELREIAKRYREGWFNSLVFNFYLALGEYEEACKIIEEQRKETKGNKGVNPALRYWELELKIATAKNVEEKVRLSKGKGEHFLTSKDLLFVYLEGNKWGEAERLLSSDKNLNLKRVLSIPPQAVVFGPPGWMWEAGEILTAKGIIAYYRKERERARQFLQEAISYSEKPLALFTPNKARALLTPKAYLGMIYYEEGKKDLARQYLKEAFSKNVPFFGDREAKKVAEKLGLDVR